LIASPSGPALRSDSSNQSVERVPEEVDVLAAYGDDHELTRKDLVVIMGRSRRTIFLWLSSGESRRFIPKIG
jgi:hypothetical protein